MIDQVEEGMATRTSAPTRGDDLIIKEAGLSGPRDSCRRGAPTREGTLAGRGRRAWVWTGPHRDHRIVEIRPTLVSPERARRAPRGLSDGGVIAYHHVATVRCDGVITSGWPIV